MGCSKYIERQDPKHPFHVLIRKNGIFESKSLYLDLEEGSNDILSPLTTALKSSIVEPKTTPQERLFEYKFVNIEELSLHIKMLKHYLKIWKKKI